MVLFWLKLASLSLFHSLIRYHMKYLRSSSTNTSAGSIMAQMTKAKYFCDIFYVKYSHFLPFLASLKFHLKFWTQTNPNSRETHSKRPRVVTNMCLLGNLNKFPTESEIISIRVTQQMKWHPQTIVKHPSIPRFLHHYPTLL